MIDLTKEIKLEGKWKKRYQLSRLAVFLIFFSVGIYVLYRILFPSANFVFSFNTPNSSKNTIYMPRNSSGLPYQNGNINKDEKIKFDTGVVGNFSNSKITLILNRSGSEKITGQIIAKKSFQAFFYPSGDPMPFKDGALLKSGLDFYIVSAGKLRKFDSENVVSKLGYSRKAFLDVLPEELTLNKSGYGISNTEQYPQDTVFKIGDDYFQQKDGFLSAFVSEKAFLTKYPSEYAIEKENAYLNDKSVSEDYIGFEDGTLLSFDGSVYVVSQNKAFPIYDPTTFTSMGFVWNEIIAANSEEIGIYDKQKIFTVNQPHPDGTVFKSIESGKYFYIKDKQKRELTTPNVLKTYSKLTPVMASEKSLESYQFCDIRPIFSLMGIYSCDISLEKIGQLPGNDFQFEATVNSDIEANTLSVNFHQVINPLNMKTSLSLLKKRVLENYIPQ